MPKDMLGRPLKVGQQVAKARSQRSIAFIELRDITKIEDGKVYLGTKVALNYPDRLLIVHDIPE
ncbi:hypothetical protein [Bradyrhizobium sp. BR 10289]|uniref:hypothetical protein n=1 Tax=Bradyrhizobium sp. BR 10289 TaxID=2749993 RepID=UPI001C64D9E2|nr:hypothetical protein [Bradyrhizobium sp. BR 10289]MBW7970967.1 hypothetical protein [Bradyrhizobium sp. BR 10289]